MTNRWRRRATRGRSESIAQPPAEVAHEAVTITHFLDLPAPGSRVTGPVLTVWGWTTDEDLAHVEVDVDGQVARARPLASIRPDVADVVDSVHALMSGFEALVDIGDRLPGDELTITATVVTGDGQRLHVGTSAVAVEEATNETDTVPPGDGGAVGGSNQGEAGGAADLRVRIDALARRHQPAGDGVRLLVVTHDLGLGGGQLYLQELLLQLLQHADLSCTVISPTGGALRSELEAAGATVYVTGTNATRPDAYEWDQLAMLTIAREFGATAVVANTAGAFGGIDLAGRIGVPSLWAIHESYPLEQFIQVAYGPGVLRTAVADRLRASLESASAVIFEAETTRRMYCDHGDPRRFVRVPYGIPIGAIDEFRARNDRTALRSAAGLDEDDVVLLCIATIQPRKGQAALLRVFARVHEDHPDAMLVLVGDQGDPWADGVRMYAERLGIADRVRIEPVSPAIYEWYALADAFVLSSDVESLPRSVLEVMAFGVPVVATDVFGLHEVIDNGVTGWLVEPRDLHELEQGLRHLLERSPDDRRKVGALGEALVRADHDSRGYATAYRRLLDGFAADPAALPRDLLDR